MYALRVLQFDHPFPFALILSFYTDCGLFDPLPLRISKDPLCVGGALPVAAYDDAYSSHQRSQERTLKFRLFINKMITMCLVAKHALSFQCLSNPNEILLQSRSPKIVIICRHLAFWAMLSSLAFYGMTRLFHRALIFIGGKLLLLSTQRTTSSSGTNDFLLKRFKLPFFQCHA